MKLLYPRSLGRTLDAVEDSLWTNRRIPTDDRKAVVDWLIQRRGGEGAYRGMFAPTAEDWRDGVRVFTGERVRSGAGTGHILGEEACRVLAQLAGRSPAACSALAHARNWLAEMFVRSKLAPHGPGMCCCGTCSVALWRNLLAGGVDHADRQLDAGLKSLRAHRNGDGRYRVFPFYYTLLALTEMNTPAAKREKRYVAPACERMLKRKAGANDRYQSRRRAVMERILAGC